MDSAANQKSGNAGGRCDETVLRRVREAAVREPPGSDVSAGASSQGMEGVVLERLSGFHDNRGLLLPMVDVRKPFWSEPVIYAYAITIRPGSIKGWGMHQIQTDRYCVLHGRVRVALFDAREDSPDRGTFRQLWFTDESPGLLRIPPGVWHADQNWGSQDAVIINYPTHAYNPTSPDKYRIDPHAGVIPFDWKLKDG